jgi:hypothetical protein
MIVKVIQVALDYYRPASGAEQATMSSFGVYDRFPIDHRFSRDELKAIERMTGLRFVRPIRGPR